AIPSMVESKDLERSTFATQAVASTDRAWRETTAGSFWLMITIFASGRSRRITRVASSPFRRGIETSMRITSGRRAFAFSIASTPSAASPHTCQFVRDKSKEPRARLTCTSSSTTKMRRQSNDFSCLEDVIFGGLGRIPQTKNIFTALGEFQASCAKKDKTETRPKG